MSSIRNSDNLANSNEFYNYQKCTNAGKSKNYKNMQYRVLVKKIKKISGKYFEIEIRKEKEKVAFMARDIESNEKSWLQVGEKEILQFVKEECENDLSLLVQKVVLQNSALEINTKMLGNNNKFK